VKGARGGVVEQQSGMNWSKNRDHQGGIGVEGVWEWGGRSLYV